MRISPVYNTKYNFSKQNNILSEQHYQSFQSKRKKDRPRKIEDSNINSYKTPIDELKERIKEAEILFNQNEIEKAAGRVVEFYNANNGYSGMSNLFKKEIKKAENTESKKPILYMDFGSNRISFSPSKIQVSFYQKDLPTKKLIINLRKYGDIKSIEANNHKIDYNYCGNSIIYNY